LMMTHKCGCNWGQNGRTDWTWELWDGFHAAIGGISGTVHWAVGRRVALRHRGKCGQSVARKNQFLELWDGHALGWVHFKDPAENEIQLWSQRKNFLEEIWIFHESTECAVIVASALPWIPATGQVDQDHS